MVDKYLIIAFICGVILTIGFYQIFIRRTKVYKTVPKSPEDEILEAFRPLAIALLGEQGDAVAFIETTNHFCVVGKGLASKHLKKAIEELKQNKENK